MERVKSVQVESETNILEVYFSFFFSNINIICNKYKFLLLAIKDLLTDRFIIQKFESDKEFQMEVTRKSTLNLFIASETWKQKNNHYHLISNISLVDRSLLICYTNFKYSIYSASNNNFITRFTRYSCEKYFYFSQKYDHHSQSSVFPDRGSSRQGRDSSVRCKRSR